MKKEIIINSAMNETRIAITEDGKLAEFFIELQDKERSIGNIYLGKVNKIVSGINAAFINIGHGQDAFLHFSDVDDSMENMITDEEDTEFPELDEEEEEELSDEKPKSGRNKKKKNIPSEAQPKGNVKQSRKPGATFRTKKTGEVQINLKEGQNVFVQVQREAYGSKGVRVTSRIGIPGRYTVLMPFEKSIGVSKKISSYVERKRLRNLAKNHLPGGVGCIIRTAAHGMSENELIKDFTDLGEKWQEIEKKAKKAEGPGLLHQDLELATSIIRDLFTKDVVKVVVDTKKLFKDITAYLKWASPELVDKVELYSGKRPIFDNFGIEKELESTYKRKVNLPGGGTIVIEQTEAMFVIDVNSGKSVTERQQEINAMNTNLEAAREIARQIRLRDLAGIILTDFIDLSKESHRKKLFIIMRKELSRDRARTVVYPLTRLSIMQITRQRVNQNITEKTTENCPTCHGRGRVSSKAVLINSIERWLKNFRQNSREFRLVMYVHPFIAEYLTEGTISRLSKLMLKYFVKIKLQQTDNINIDQFRFESVRRQKDITNEFN